MSGRLFGSGPTAKIATLEQMIERHPQLVPTCPADGSCYCDETWRAHVRIASPHKVLKPAVGAERTAARVFDNLGISWIYEPLHFVISCPPGSSRQKGFQPDFWLDDMGVIIELCRTEQAKNYRLLRLKRHWPNLKALVITDDHVNQLKAMAGLTRERFAEMIELGLAWQAARLEIEGDDPFGYVARGLAFGAERVESAGRATMSIGHRVSLARCTSRDVGRASLRASSIAYGHDYTQPAGDAS